MTFLSFRDEFPPPCAGKYDLFDSTLQADHHIAKQLCDDCPFIIACNDRLQDTLADSEWARPEGTWAGVLVGVKGRPGRPRRVR